jgi:hypothetical protein
LRETFFLDAAIISLRVGITGPSIYKEKQIASYSTLTRIRNFFLFFGRRWGFFDASGVKRKKTLKSSRRTVEKALRNDYTEN